MPRRRRRRRQVSTQTTMHACCRLLTAQVRDGGILHTLSPALHVFTQQVQFLSDFVTHKGQAQNDAK